MLSKKSVALKLETLEERANPSSFVQNGILHIEGTAGNDNVSVTMQNGKIKVADNGVVTLYDPAQVTSNTIRFRGLAGNDNFSHDTALKVFAYGMAGNDYLLGSNTAQDVFDGGAGSDVLVGSGGNDQLYGGVGIDYLYGNAGDDLLDGGDDRAADFLQGGPGKDSFQQDLAWNGMFWFNRDKAQDFGFGDIYYN